MPSKRMINATDEIKAPVQSKLNFFPNDLSSDLRINKPNKNATIATNKLEKNIDLHPNCSIKTPAITGPKIAPIPMMETYKPRALPLSFSGKILVAIYIPFACIQAVPKPWKILAKSNILYDVAFPAMRAPIPKITNPVRYIFLIPTVSASLPIGRNKALVVRILAKIIHCTVGMSKAKYFEIAGIAMFRPD